MPTERYEILHIDLDAPIPSVRCPDDAAGLAFVFRFEGAPAGFCMHPMTAGDQLTSEDLARLGFAWCREIVLSRRVQQELQEDSPAAATPTRFPSLDIAICTHGRATDLARLLENLERLGLTRASENTRVIVIDNAPKDTSTEDVVRRFHGVRYVTEPLQGLDFARNRAVQVSTADLLAFIDDDVIVDECWFRGLQQAWALDPHAGAFTGPILPAELETRAQVTFEQMGGFGKSFTRTRFTKTLPQNDTFPVGAGIMGAGANMVFRTQVLRDLGGFDDALDTGAPLPGGGDLDMFYRVIRAGYPLVYEPTLTVYHRHRREYKKLRHQMWTWGTGTMAYLTKSWQTDPEYRPHIQHWILWWGANCLSKMFVPFLRKTKVKWPMEMVAAELAGGVVGLCGEYGRSLRRVEAIRRRAAIAEG